MGYTTDFKGSLRLEPHATAEQVDYIKKISETPRMRRDVTKLKDMFKGEEGLNGEYGIEGEFFVGGLGRTDSSVIDNNAHAYTQPGLWCDWVLTPNGKELEWNGGEKFYNYIEWLKYMIDNFFEKWGIKLNGEIKWSGEEMADVGVITVKDNHVTTSDDKPDFEEWLMSLETQTLTEELKEQILQCIKNDYLIV